MILALWWMATDAPPGDVISPIAGTGIVGAICLVLGWIVWWFLRLQRKDLEEARADLRKERETHAAELRESQTREREAYQSTLPALTAAGRALEKAHTEHAGGRDGR